MSPRARDRREPTDRSSDAELTTRCAKGDASAWNELVQRYRQLIYSIPRRMGLDPSDADDVFQTTFTRLAERIDSLNEPSKIQAWLVTTARREALRAAGRRVAVLSPEEMPEPVDPAELPSEELERLQDQMLVRRALEKLGGPCRELLEKLYARRDDERGNTYEIVAKELGLSLGSIGPTRMRCLRKLLSEFRKLSETD